VTDEPGPSGRPSPASGPFPSRGTAPPSGTDPDADADRTATVISFSPRGRVDAAAHDGPMDEAGHDAAAAPSGYDADDEALVTGTGDTMTDEASADRRDRPVDWAWVEEWRAGGEPVPWASGLGLAAFSALVVGVAVWVLSAGLAGRPVLAIGVNVLVAGGLAPAMWLSRGLPVLRWIALGCAVGVVAGWICALMMLPLPTP
jgi:hypothetical protein